MIKLKKLILTGLIAFAFTMGVLQLADSISTNHGSVFATGGAPVPLDWPPW